MVPPPMSAKLRAMPGRATTAGDLFISQGHRVKVLLPLPLAGPYDYRIPSDARPARGSFVVVPLGQTERIGVVWSDGDVEADPDGVSDDRLKDILSVLDVPPLADDEIAFIDWVAAYTLAPPGAFLRMAMSVPAALQPPRPKRAYRRAVPCPEIRMTPARRRVLDVLGEGPPLQAQELALEAGIGTGVVRGLFQAGALAEVPVEPHRRWPAPDPMRHGPVLSKAQAAAAADLRGKVADDDYSVTLLDGVTGSGKTEVYFEAVAAALAAGRQVLVLLPEIALSAQWLARFEARFGAPPALWHSEVTPTRRRDTWRAIAEGRVRIVVGARSALHLPFHALGLIVIDEEHDQAFKQEDGAIYHARDMAVVRARFAGCPIVLISATPSLETWTNVETGRYDRLHLPERHGASTLPDVTLVDLRKDRPRRGTFLAPTLRAALQETLEDGGQGMLFLNRRGYAPLTLCRACGHRLNCPQCTAWLVEHRLTGRLQCHHCGFASPVPAECPECGAEHSMVACGPGVERLAEEVAGFLPDARTAIVTSDTLSGPAAAEEFVRTVIEREIDLIIGTQIVAKGYHFPDLALVGVVDADLGLGGGDLRAAERTFQLLHQVAGRAGREDRPGRVFVQTHDPAASVLRAIKAGDREGFLAAEARLRADAGMPPFGRLAAVILSAPDPDTAESVAAQLARTAPFGKGFQVLGPAPAPLTVLRGRHRQRFLVKATRDISVQKVLRDWLTGFRLPSQVRLSVDVDPYSFV